MRKPVMPSRRCLAIINYAMGICIVALALGESSSLSDVKHFIEVEGWHHCWNYRDFRTYVASVILFYSVFGGAFLLSWILLRSRYWRFVYVVFGMVCFGIGLQIWYAWSCAE
jgi:hypothetical protein